MTEVRRLEVEDFPLEDLRPHPLNERLYPTDDEEDKELEESIRQHGILDALVALPDGTIISGTRRWRIARKLGLETAPVEFKEFDDPEVAVIEYNRYRKKTPRIIHNEAQLLRERLQAKAKEKQALGGVLAHLPQEERMEVSANSPKAHTRELVAEQLKAVGVDISPRQLDKIEFIYKHEDVAKPVVERLDKGETTVHKAYQQIKKIMEPERGEEKPETWKCIGCGGEFDVVAPTYLALCPSCVVDYLAWKAERDLQGI